MPLHTFFSWFIKTFDPALHHQIHDKGREVDIGELIPNYEEMSLLDNIAKWCLSERDVTTHLAYFFLNPDGTIIENEAEIHKAFDRFKAKIDAALSYRLCEEALVGDTECPEGCSYIPPKDCSLIRLDHCISSQKSNFEVNYAPDLFSGITSATLDPVLPWLMEGYIKEPGLCLEIFRLLLMSHRANPEEPVVLLNLDMAPEVVRPALSKVDTDFKLTNTKQFTVNFRDVPRFIDRFGNDFKNVVLCESDIDYFESWAWYSKNSSTGQNFFQKVLGLVRGDLFEYIVRNLVLEEHFALENHKPFKYRDRDNPFVQGRLPHEHDDMVVANVHKVFVDEYVKSGFLDCSSPERTPSSYFLENMPHPYHGTWHKSLGDRLATSHAVEIDLVDPENFGGLLNV